MVNPTLMMWKQRLAKFTPIKFLKQKVIVPIAYILFSNDIPLLTRVMFAFIAGSLVSMIYSGVESAVNDKSREVETSDVTALYEIYNKSCVHDAFKKVHTEKGTVTIGWLEHTVAKNCGKKADHQKPAVSKSMQVKQELGI